MEEGQEVLSEYLNRLMNYQIVEGTTVGDVFSVNFLVDATGNFIVAAILLFVGFTLSGFFKRRIIRLTEQSRHFDKTMGAFLATSSKRFAWFARRA